MQCEGEGGPPFPVQECMGPMGLCVPLAMINPLYTGPSNRLSAAEPQCEILGGNREDVRVQQFSSSAVKCLGLERVRNVSCNVVLAFLDFRILGF